jgi:hypothetical protein
VTLAIIGGWLIRNWLMTGNPIYPIGFEFMPSLDWTKWNAGRLTVLEHRKNVFPSWESWLPLHRILSREWSCLAQERIPALLGLVLLLPAVVFHRRMPYEIRSSARGDQGRGLRCPPP